MKLKTKLITLVSLIGLCSCSIKYDSDNLHTNTPKTESPTETAVNTAKTDSTKPVETTATAEPETTTTTTTTDAPVTTDNTEPTTDTASESSDPSTEIEQKADLIVGYYADSIDETMIGNLKTAFETYCSNNTLSISNVEYRAYSGKVAAYTTEIINSADLDVMIGTGKAKGNMTDEYLESADKTITVNGSDRYIWTFKNFGKNTENRDYFLTFLNTDEAKNVLSPKTTDDETTPYLTLGWWNYSKSGLTADIMSNLEKAMDSYLKTEGVTDSRIASIVIRGYEQTKVADLGGAINKDGDVDVLVGVGNNINSTGGVSVIEKLGDFTMGGVGSRYIARLTATDAAVKIYNWLQTDEVKAVLNPTTTA